ncbi:uroporphyrinogen-III C-methyltransferase [Gluconacetobacter azotocaptans]|uniref:Siroheme synthase n=1 Tax=Gluconacetobacter azotocaptans TaxID=142834 RepID=A0A7W4JQ04_9PROT|nr:siroheme synthase CysG [Gluconacetobacter azotocaptans]MBB2188794.1 uroporphyrinogen-III C-methyltransferase [Gluconacetobacter azotocaptans]GBQ31058.1 siroheme synthase [Gluconacetobacter azotocaptans DSM 13594]
MTVPGDPGWFPLALRLHDARVLVVGGGGIALNKVRLLLAHGARIEIVATHLDDTLEQWLAEGRVALAGADATPDLLRALLPGCRLVYAATDDRALNRVVAALARGMNIPVCAVDDPAPSTFITPAQIHRGPVRIAISTGGSAPVLARRLRERIEAVIPAGLDGLARFLEAERARVVARCPDIARRRRVWEDFLDGPGATAAGSGDTATARQVLDRLLDGGKTGGEVWLVGAGPGDPDLLTLRALHLMQNADSVLYDQLLPPDVLDRVRRDAERVFVGKQRNRHTMPQADINAEMIRRARAGERVLRLKGGDPFIFGRGGEEIEALMGAGIPFQVVPGITAASGCAAYAGIPLTHRDCAQSCLFVTGHARADGTLDLPWDSMARRGQTVAIYMGVTALPALCETLIRHGLPAGWPAAVVERGTQPDQRVLTGTLGDLSDLARRNAVTSPALVLVGEVVNHRVITPPPMLED